MGVLRTDRIRSRNGKPHELSASASEILLSSEPLRGNLYRTELSVPTIHCGGCIQKIEKAVSKLPGIEYVRVNLSTKRVTVHWHAEVEPPALIETLKLLGHEAHLHEPDSGKKDPVFSELIRALAVAGFAASNIMVLSVSIWSGAEPATRDLFHWISAFIAFPALVYSGRVFFRSAGRSLRQGQTNMDVPISIGVMIAFSMSFYDTIQHGEHAYFDASVSLLFFLLIGRTLDHLMREKARSAVRGLASLAARGAMVLRADNSRDYLPVSEIRTGMKILLAAGERVPVDARIEEGTSDLDNSLASGESMPLSVGPGSILRAGTLNLTGPLTIVAIASAADSFLAEMLRLMEVAEAGRGSYRRLADRVSQLYAPVVHLAALFSFLGWVFATGDFHRAVTIAVAVLIITCPCALGLAVPMVQVMAARRLFENGIMVKDGSAMERLKDVDTVVFDKTGTLTLGRLRLRERTDGNCRTLAIAAAMASHSRHPRSQALYAAGVEENVKPVSLDQIREHPGFGLEASSEGGIFRLGRADWALQDRSETQSASEATAVLSKDGMLIDVFHFDDVLRSGALDTVSDLMKQEIAIEMISGDNISSVTRAARDLGIENFSAGYLPGEKSDRIAALAASGRKVLMVGDGLNDAPALAAAFTSMSPATGADIGRNGADFVFLHESLTAVSLALSVSRAAARLIRQNFVLAIAYNVVAVPIAILGHVTPLIAALAMSGSSIVVVANAMRLGKDWRSQRNTANGIIPGPSTLKAEPVQ